MKITNRDVLPIFSLLMIFVLYNNNIIYEPIALIMSILLAIISVIYPTLSFISIVNKKTIEKDIFELLLSFLIFSILTAILSFNGPSPMIGLQRAFQLLSVWGVIYTFYTWGSTRNLSIILKITRNFLVILISFYCFIALIFGAKSDFSGFLINPNGFGMWITIVALMVAGASRKNKLLLFFTIAAIYLVYISSSRTSLLALIAGIGILYIPKPLITSNFFKIFLILFLIAFSFLSIYMTIYFDLSLYNEFVRDNSGKNLQSGRNFIWPVIVEFIFIKPWLGWGSGINLSDFLNKSYSMHNYFLQIIMQTGFIGFSIFLLIIFKIYKIIYKIADIRYLKLALSIFVSLIIMQSFEVTIFQNNLALSYPVWATIGLVLGNNNIQKRLKNA